MCPGSTSWPCMPIPKISSVVLEVIGAALDGGGGRAVIELQVDDVMILRWGADILRGSPGARCASGDP